MVNASRCGRALLAWAPALALAGCATPPGWVACRSGSAMTETSLFLGLSTSGGTVAPADFAAFVEAEVTPRWPEGYTILEGQGLWFSEQRQASEREDSRVLLRIHDGGAQASADIEAIRAAYVSRFAQESVLRTDRPVCADF